MSLLVASLGVTRIPEHDDLRFTGIIALNKKFHTSTQVRGARVSCPHPLVDSTKERHPRMRGTLSKDSTLPPPRLCVKKRGGEAKVGTACWPERNHLSSLHYHTFHTKPISTFRTACTFSSCSAAAPNKTVLPKISHALQVPGMC